MDVVLPPDLPIGGNVDPRVDLGPHDLGCGPVEELAPLVAGRRQLLEVGAREVTVGVREPVGDGDVVGFGKRPDRGGQHDGIASMIGL